MTTLEPTVGGPVTEALRNQVRRLMGPAHRDLAELVGIRSVANPDGAPAAEVTRAARWVDHALRDAGLDHVELVDMPYGPPVVYGHSPAPPGAPTVLLYGHYDVQPVPDESAWQSPPWELTTRDGRWYGRGAADCKGNIVMHLTALRALRAVATPWPVGIKVVVEGSAGNGLGDLEQWVPANVDKLRADTMLVCDGGNFAVGIPTLTVTLRGLVEVVVTVETMRSTMHSGTFGGPAPDALAALIRMLATLRDERGDTTILGLEQGQIHDGVEYPSDQFRIDANVLDGVDLLGSGEVSDMLWARPALTVLGIDCPAVAGSAAAIPHRARARLSLRVPPGITADAARDALVRHLRSVVPWHARVDIVQKAKAEPWVGQRSGPAARAMVAAMYDAYCVDAVREAQGGSIPLCNVLHQTFPDAEMMVLGVEEPRSLVHAADESVDPGEIEHMALTEALFLLRCT